MRKLGHVVWFALAGLGAVAAEPKASPTAAFTEVAAAGHWPSFRGPYACGVAEGQNLPEQWDAAKGLNVRWLRKLPGLAHSSPIVWGHRLFVTTAISSLPEATFRPGLYGDGDASPDRSPHRWQVLCLDKRTGQILWERTAAEGVPKDRRHVKGTYANATPATDGRYVVALLGSEGLFAYDLEGRRLWQKDLGRLNAGAYDAPSYEWGTASSPIIYRNLVIVQCDIQEGSFILAADLKTGATVWRTPRQELPSWGTPTIYPGRNRPELITNGANYIRGYDPDTGQELWRLGGSSKITAPTPVFADDLIIVASGRAPERPIFAIRPGGAGDITPEAGEASTKFIAWRKVRKGPYMPTPMIYRGLLYVLNNNGLFDAYDLASGEELFGQRIPHRGSGFSASPVAADGRIYLSSEDGDIFVVQAGREFRLLSTTSMGEALMATPALSQGALYVRGQHHLFAIGK